MEDVQQRRERLAAMRVQATLEDVSDATASTAPGLSLSLPDPMMDTTPVTAAGRSKESGFDFYTDPLTAFTSAKRRKPADGEHTPGPGVVRAPHWQPASGPPPVFNHPPMHISPPLFSGNHGWQPIPYQPTYGAPGPPLRPPYNMDQPRNFTNQSVEMGFAGSGTGMYSTAGRRGGFATDVSGRGRGYGSSSNSGRGASHAGGYPARGAPGRGFQGRGGHRGGRTASAKEQPHLYFKKSMVEDPWKALEEKLRGKAKD